jgi:hypothetical protein
MDSIEADYENLRGVLPKGEYQELDNQVLGQLLRTLNPDELKKVTATAATLVATNRENYAQIHEGEQAKIGSITNRWELFNE